ncbi:unnamed protein product [Schistocephalus solidus]|uniref:COMM domain-containing protein n=1 Tax=Schistocephalus solidus TaxID=70667 RepID=A0A183S7S0_SCHSO|nr:unnamed protein product [Schistocephalus solidus]
MDGNGVEVVENFNKTEHLGWFFASVFTRELQLQLDHVRIAVKDAGPVIENIHFPEPLVERELQNLKEVTLSGPNDLPPKFLKELAGELSNPEWKAANIYPIYMSGARSKITLPTLDNLHTYLRICNPDNSLQVLLMIEVGSDGFASLVMDYTVSKVASR